MKTSFDLKFDFKNDTQLMLNGNQLVEIVKVFLDKGPSSYTPEEIKKYNKFVALLSEYLKGYISQLDVFDTSITLNGIPILQGSSDNTDDEFISNLDVSLGTPAELAPIVEKKQPWWRRFFKKW